MMPGPSWCCWDSIWFHLRRTTAGICGPTMRRLDLSCGQGRRCDQEDVQLVALALQASWTSHRCGEHRACLSLEAVDAEHAETPSLRPTLRLPRSQHWL